MTTERLYETNGHLSECMATVLSCKETNGGYDVVLDRTVIFPEGGGQPSDTGSLDGIPVTGAELRGGVVYHRTASPIETGRKISCKCDMNTRFSRMQCHTGEHIVSGIIHRKYGFNNVGFHMGSREVTLDVDGELTSSELDQVEWSANEAVISCVPVKILYPSPEEAAKLDYRSKLEIKSGLRLVEIEGYDLCACCAPHVSSTGEIGQIKLLGHIRYKGGSRIRMLCGFEALSDYRGMLSQIGRIMDILSAKRDECAEKVQSLWNSFELSEEKCRKIARDALINDADKAAPTDGNMLFFEPPELASGLRELVNAALPKCGGICAAFAGKDGDYSFVVGSASADLRLIIPELCTHLSARCGGSSSMIQGTAKTSAPAIRRFIMGKD